MPIPKPKKDEKKKEFISRCMSDDVMVDEYPEDQRMAICTNSWKENKVKKQSATMKPMTDFKYFVKIEKAYQEEGDWYVQGIASGTKEDLEDCRMAKSALQNFVDGLPLPLTDNHAHGDVLANLGEVVEASITEDDQMFIKARLDKDNPSCEYIVKKVGAGKKFAFSIEGMLKKAQTVFSDALDKFVTEYIDIEPEAISITTMPAYEASFLQVVSKSYKNYQNKIKKEQDMEKKKIEAIEELKEDVVEKQEENVKEEVIEEIKEESVESSEATEKEEKNDVVQPSQEVASEDESKSEEVVETTEETEEDSEESQEASEIEQLKQQITDLTSAVDTLISGKVEPAKEDPAPVVMSPAQEAVELLAKQSKVIKSLADEVEKLQRMPLQKKTKAKLPDIEKSVEDNEPETIKDLAKNLI